MRFFCIIIGMTITYQEEQLKDFIPEFDVLLEPHMTEINITQRFGFKFKPDYQQYIKMQEFGVLVVLTCRNDKELVGYTVFNIFPSIRFPDCKMAKEDLYYIKPEFRGKGLGKQLFIETEKLLKKKGVDQIVFTTKTYQDYSPIFESLGYEFYEKHFIKKLQMKYRVPTVSDKLYYLITGYLTKIGGIAWGGETNTYQPWLDEPQGSVTVEAAPPETGPAPAPSGNDNNGGAPAPAPSGDNGGGGGGGVDQGVLNQLYEQYLGRSTQGDTGSSSWLGKDLNSVIAGITGSAEYNQNQSGGGGGGGGGGQSITPSINAATPRIGGPAQSSEPQDINAIYQKYLGRNVDTSGATTFAGWAPADIIKSIQASPEYSTYNTTSLFNQYLGRNPDAGALTTFAGKTPEEIKAAITASAEFAPVITNYLYKNNLGRSASPAETSLWAGKTPQEIAAGIMASNEYKAMPHPTDVNALYQYYLGRPADQAGLDTWKDKTPEEVKAGIINSDEYQSKVIKYSELPSAAQFDPETGQLKSTNHIYLWRDADGNPTNDREKAVNGPDSAEYQKQAAANKLAIDKVTADATPVTKDTPGGEYYTNLAARGAREMGVEAGNYKVYVTSSGETVVVSDSGIFAMPALSSYTNSAGIANQRMGYRNTVYSGGEYGGKDSIALGGVSIPIVTPEFLVDKETGNLLFTKDSKLPITIQDITPVDPGGFHGIDQIGFQITTAIVAASVGWAMGGVMAEEFAPIVAQAFGSSVAGSAAAAAATTAMTMASTGAIMAAGTGGDIAAAAAKGAIIGAVTGGMGSLAGAAVGSVANNFVGESTINSITEAIGVPPGTINPADAIKNVQDVIGRTISMTFASAVAGKINSDNLMTELFTNLAASSVGQFAGAIVKQIDPNALQGAVRAAQAAGQIATSALLKGQDVQTAVMNNMPSLVANFFIDTAREIAAERAALNPTNPFGTENIGLTSGAVDNVLNRGLIDNYINNSADPLGVLAAQNNYTGDPIANMRIVTNAMIDQNISKNDILSNLAATYNIDTKTAEGYYQNTVANNVIEKLLVNASNPDAVLNAAKLLTGNNQDNLKYITKEMQAQGLSKDEISRNLQNLYQIPKDKADAYTNSLSISSASKDKTIVSTADNFGDAFKEARQLELKRLNLMESNTQLIQQHFLLPWHQKRYLSRLCKF